MIPFTAYGWFSCLPLRVSFGGVVGVGFGVEVGLVDGVGVADGVGLAEVAVGDAVVGAGVVAVGADGAVQPAVHSAAVRDTATREWRNLTDQLYQQTPRRPLVPGSSGPP